MPVLDPLRAEPHGLGAGFDGGSGVHREAALAPRDEVVDDRLGDLAARDERAQHLGAKEPLDRGSVEGEQVAEAPVRQPAASGQEHVEMRMPTEELARGLQEADGPGDDALAAVPCAEVEVESAPGAAGQLSEEVAAVPLAGQGVEAEAGTTVRASAWVRPKSRHAPNMPSASQRRADCGFYPEGSPSGDFRLPMVVLGGKSSTRLRPMAFAR